jgi:acyl-CoA thioester hydrolase
MQRRPHREPAGPDPRDLVGPFLHETAIPIRFADTDAMGHVNNAKYLTYCETARIRYWTDVTGEGFLPGSDEAESLILAQVRIAYRAQAFHGETVTVQTRAGRIGRSSFTLEHRLSAGQPGVAGRLVAVAETVLVRFDYVTDTPIALDPELVEVIEAFEGRTLTAPTSG